MGDQVRGLELEVLDCVLKKELHVRFDSLLSDPALLP